MSAPTHRAYTVIKREGKDDYWLNLGVAFRHEDSEGFNILRQALPTDVTVAVGALVSAGLITTHRSSITIVDCKGLEKRANGTYVPVDEGCWQRTILQGAHCIIVLRLPPDRPRMTVLGVRCRCGVSRLLRHHQEGSRSCVSSPNTASQVRRLRQIPSAVVDLPLWCHFIHKLPAPKGHFVMKAYDGDGPVPQASLHHLAAMLRSAVDAIISIDTVGVIESVNPATEKLFGYDAAELVGQNVKMLMPEPYRNQHDNYIRQHLKTGQRKIIGIGREVVGQRKDGSPFPMHLSVSEYEIDGERHFAGIVHDLTAQRQAEVKSLRQETLFEAVIHDAPQGIFIGDESRKIFVVNPAATRIFGYAHDELIGQKSRVLYATDEDYERMTRSRVNLDATPTENAAEPIRLTFRRKNGETFPGEIVATIIRDPHRSVLGLMGLVRDMSEQVKQEEALRKTQRMDALGKLTGGIAHDFNNLLTIIIGNHELFEASPDAREARELIRRANEAAEMGARLTARLLTFSRQRKLEPTIINLNEQILNMMELLRRSIDETIAVSTSLAAGLWSVQVDPSEVENAILNLAINARDAMPHGGRLILETQSISLDDPQAHAYDLTPGDYVRLSVSDTGTGMPPEVVARAFEPFFTTKSAGRGTGLGLASIHGFVKQSGGHATIYSEPGRGTAVNLYLPKAVAHEARVSPGAAPEAATATGETVLVVEDNPELRRLSLRRLKLLGYHVFEADSGPAALVVLDAGERIDLIFSDVVMPGGMTGYELAVHARERIPLLKVLLTSGYDAGLASEQDTTGSELRVLRKPYKQAELARALREVLAA